MLTKRQNAKQASASKATLTRAYRRRRKSANKNAEGGWDSAMKRTAPHASAKVETHQRAALMTRLMLKLIGLKRKW